MLRNRNCIRQKALQTGSVRFRTYCLRRRAGGDDCEVAVTVVGDRVWFSSVGKMRRPRPRKGSPLRGKGNPGELTKWSGPSRHSGDRHTSAGGVQALIELAGLTGGLCGLGAGHDQLAEPHRV
jgi:hypothetical protein